MRHSQHTNFRTYPSDILHFFVSLYKLSEYLPAVARYNCPMTVYAEYAFLDNFTMDCLLLFCAAVTLKIPFKRYRVALGGAVGTVSAMLSVYVQGFWVYPVKILCLVCMCVVAIGFGKKLFWYILLTLAYTFVTGGAIVGIFNLLHVQYASENGLVYNMPVPLFVYVLAVTLTVFLCYCIAVFVRQTRKIAPYLVKAQVTLHDKTHTVWGFCDSGNSVNCEGVPVCFVTKKFANVSDYFANKILRGECKKVKVATLNGEKTVSAVPATVKVGEITKQVYLALPANRCQTRYELLLNGEFCEVKNETATVT